MADTKEAYDASLTELLPELIKDRGARADEDVLQPRHLGSLARTCKVIKAAVKDALDKLKVEHQKAVLFRKLRTTFERLVAKRPTELCWWNKGLVAADAPALTNVLKSEAVERVEELNLMHNKLGDEGAAAIAAAAAGGGMPRLSIWTFTTIRSATPACRPSPPPCRWGLPRAVEAQPLGQQHWLRGRRRPR